MPDRPGPDDPDKVVHIDFQTGRRVRPPHLYSVDNDQTVENVAATPNTVFRFIAYELVADNVPMASYSYGHDTYHILRDDSSDRAGYFVIVDFGQPARVPDVYRVRERVLELAGFDVVDEVLRNPDELDRAFQSSEAAWFEADDRRPGQLLARLMNLQPTPGPVMELEPQNQAEADRILLAASFENRLAEVLQGSLQTTLPSAEEGHLIVYRTTDTGRSTLVICDPGMHQFEAFSVQSDRLFEAQVHNSQSLIDVDDLPLEEEHVLAVVAELEGAWDPVEPDEYASVVYRVNEVLPPR